MLLAYFAQMKSKTISQLTNCWFPTSPPHSFVLLGCSYILKQNWMSSSPSAKMISYYRLRSLTRTRFLDIILRFYVLKKARTELKCKTYILVLYSKYHQSGDAEDYRSVYRRGSRYEVNYLSCETKEELRKKKNLGNPDVFEKAKHE